MERSLSRYCKMEGFSGTRSVARLLDVNERTVARWWNTPADREEILIPRIQELKKARKSWGS